MRFPSFFISGEGTRAWSVRRAAAYGGGIGALAALFKTLGPLREAGSAPAHLLEIAAVAFGFALLCSAAAHLAEFHCAAADLARFPAEKATPPQRRCRFCPLREDRSGELHSH